MLAQRVYVYYYNVGRIHVVYNLQNVELGLT